jgi:hypothetical protein
MGNPGAPRPAVGNPQPVEPDPPAPPLNWLQGNEVDLDELNGVDDQPEEPQGQSTVRRQRSRNELVIDQMERARDGERPIILYVSTEDTSPRYSRAREQCAELQRIVFENYRVATMMQDFVLIRVNIEDLDAQTIRRYGITRQVAPQILMYNFQVRRLYSMQGVPDAITMIERMQFLKDHCEQLQEQLARRSR